MSKVQNTHQVIDLEEWQTIDKDVTLNDKDRYMLQTLSAKETSYLVIEELRSSLRISSSHWIGVLRLDTIEFRVHPKLAGENFNLVKMIDYVADMELYRRLILSQDLKTGGYSLLEIIAWLFVESCESVLKGGLLQDYIEREDDLPFVRGRILFEQQLLKHMGRNDRIVCRYSEWESDIVENQILALALTILSKRIDVPFLNFRLNRLKQVFLECCSLNEFDYRQANTTLVYNRLNAHYREAHQIAALIIDTIGLEDIYERGRTTSFSFFIDMNALYEGFIARWLLELLKDQNYDVSRPGNNPSIIWNTTNRKSFKSVRPDITIREKGAAGLQMVIDAKYKLYDEKRVQNSDIFQLFLYAMAYTSSDKDTKPCSVLMYPSSDSRPNVREIEIRNINKAGFADVILISLNIPSILSEIGNKNTGDYSIAVRTLVNRILR